MSIDFFTEIDKIDGNQTALDAYGPDNGSGVGPVYNPSPTTKWHATSKFQVTEKARAFACVNGNLMVQQSAADPSLVNLIIKPAFNVDNIDVAYFIYRGIEKAGILRPTGMSNPFLGDIHEIIPYSDGVNTLVRNYWLSDDVHNPTDGDPSVIGYGAAPEDNDSLIGVLNNTHSDLKSVFVAAGTWIGDFVDSNSLVTGFEVVTKTNDFAPTFGYLRKAEHTIEVTTGLTASQEAARRESILSFMDPAAFYGRLFGRGVKYWTTNADGTRTRETTNTSVNSTHYLYSKLIEWFHTSNRVYIDIRGDLGHSYNAYGNYHSGQENDIQYHYGTSVPTSHPYATQSWPLLYFDAAQTTNSTHNQFRLRLRIDDNSEPLFYLPNVKDYNGNVKKRLKRLKRSGDWTKDVRFKFRNVGGTSSSKLSIANHIKGYYLRGKMVLESDYDPRLPREEQYYHNAFLSIDTPSLGSYENDPYKTVLNPNPVCIKEPVNHANGLGGYEVIMKQEAFWDEQKVLFSTTMIDESVPSGKKFYPYIFPEDLSFNNKVFNGKEIKGKVNKNSLKHRLKILCRKFDGGTEDDFNIPSINLYKSKDGASTKYGKENCLLLGLTHAELNALKAHTGLDNSHERYIHLEFNEEFTENRGPTGSQYRVRYFKFKVRLQGIDPNTANFTIQTPQITRDTTPEEIFVYSRDGQFFSSKANAKDIPVSMRNRYPNETGTGQVELEHYIAFHIYKIAKGPNQTGTLNTCQDHHRYIKISDNLDFALMVPDDQEQDCHSPDEATAFNNKQVFYFYHEHEFNGNKTVREVGKFHLVVADRLRRYGNVAGIGNNWTQIADYSDCNENNYYSVTNVWAKNSHRQNDLRHVTTYGWVWNSTLKKYEEVWRAYLNEVQQKIFMIRLVNNEQPTLTSSTFQLNGNDAMTYSGTLRLYANPVLAAAVIGALHETDQVIESGGFAFADGSCFPSANHVNGEAFDSDYLPDVDNERNFIRRLHCWGFRRIIIGETTIQINGVTQNYRGTSGAEPRLITGLPTNTLTVDSNQGHKDHLHTEKHDYWSLKDDPKLKL
ncbi:MAG: hypothetical protein AAFQ98_02750 [Bacteroidota bacterium]